MKFREMCKEMTQKEIEFVLRIVYPYSHLADFNRILKQNFIKVSFELSDKYNLYHVDFLPDDIYVYDRKDNDSSDGEPIKSGDILYDYQQFMIAKGYSEIWLNNPYCL